MTNALPVLLWCDLCKAVQRHEELTDADGRRPSSRRVLVCDACGYVTAPLLQAMQPQMPDYRIGAFRRRRRQNG